MLAVTITAIVGVVGIAFIGLAGTSSASELVINAFTPYLHANSALIGTNTYGKPVGQIALDLGHLVRRPHELPFREMSANLFKTGVTALPITASQKPSICAIPMAMARTG